MGTQIFTVTGMHCDHCVGAVTAEVSKLPGVRSVDVDLSSGSVTVTADREVGESEMAVAVDEAGYELVRDVPDQPR
jgi:copper chaperone